MPSFGANISLFLPLLSKDSRGTAGSGCTLAWDSSDGAQKTQECSLLENGISVLSLGLLSIPSAHLVLLTAKTCCEEKKWGTGKFVSPTGAQTWKLGMITVRVVLSHPRPGWMGLEQPGVVEVSLPWQGWGGMGFEVPPNPTQSGTL